MLSRLSQWQPLVLPRGWCCRLESRMSPLLFRVPLSLGSCLELVHVVADVTGALALQLFLRLLADEIYYKRGSSAWFENVLLCP